MYLLFKTQNFVSFATLEGGVASHFLSQAFNSKSEWSHKKQKMSGGETRDKFTWIGDDNSTIKLEHRDSSINLYLDKGFMFYVIT